MLSKREDKDQTLQTVGCSTSRVPRGIHQQPKVTKLTACPPHCPPHSPALREENRLPSTSKGIRFHPESLLGAPVTPKCENRTQVRYQYHQGPWQKPLRLSSRGRKCLTVKHLNWGCSGIRMGS